MNCWEILGIAQTTDKSLIRKAYATMAAKYHPEENPERFQQIHVAYQQALRYAEKAIEQETAFPQNNIQKYETVIQQSNTQKQNTAFEQIAIFGQQNITEQKAIFGQQSVTEQKPASEQIPIPQEETVSNPYLEKIAKQEDTFYLEEQKIDDLITEFCDLISSNDFYKVESWKQILESQAFREVHTNKKFIQKFTRVLREIRISKQLAGVIYVAMDFDKLEQLYEFYDYGELKKTLTAEVTGQQRKMAENSVMKKHYKRYGWIALVVILIVLRIITTSAKMERMSRTQEELGMDSTGETIEILADFVTGGNKGTKKGIAASIKKNYGREVEVKEINPSEKMVEIYYLIEEGKTEADYQWYELTTVDNGIPVSFHYAVGEKSWADYTYRYTIAVFDYYGLSFNLENVDKTNEQFYLAGERVRTYPTIQIYGKETDEFYTNLSAGITELQSTQGMYRDKDCIELEFHHLKSGQYFKLEITQDQPWSAEDLKNYLGGLQ